MKRDIRQKVSEFAEKVAAAIAGSVKAPKSDEETDVENSDFYACGSDGGGEEDGSYAAGADGSEDAFGEDENESENGEDPEEEESGDAPETAEAREETRNEEALATDAAREAERQLAQIRRAFPDCGATSIEELGDAFAKLMRAGESIGLSAADAYAATHISQLRANAEKEADGRARARIGSKAHLLRSEGNQSGLCEVPRGVYEKYRRLLPNVSDREIREHYNRSQHE